MTLQKQIEKYQQLQRNTNSYWVIPTATEKYQQLQSYIPTVTEKYQQSQSNTNSHRVIPTVTEKYQQLQRNTNSYRKIQLLRKPTVTEKTNSYSKN